MLQSRPGSTLRDTSPLGGAIPGSELRQRAYGTTTRTAVVWAGAWIANLEGHAMPEMGGDFALLFSAISEETIAAGAIMDVRTDGKFDWRACIRDNEFLATADWVKAMACARAALETTRRASC